MSFSVSSPAFSSGAAIPARYTCSGGDLSPPLEWNGVPAQAKSLALVCEDPDAPGGTFYHWGIHDLPASCQSLAEGGDAEALSQGAKAVFNSFGSAGYRGPCPPKGHGVHHYHFRLFALNTSSLEIAKRADCHMLLKGLQPHVVASTELVGTFSR